MGHEDHLAPLGGSFYNFSAIDSISKIAITYKTASDSGDDLPTLYYGLNGYEHEVDFPDALTEKTYTFDAPKDAPVSYFKIEGGDCKLTIASLEIEKGEPSGRDISFRAVKAGEGHHRARPNRVTGELQDGETIASAPFPGLGEKSYTYYSNDYVLAHPEVALEAAMTDSIDVANYCALFGHCPAN